MSILWWLMLGAVCYATWYRRHDIAHTLRESRRIVMQRRK